MLRNNLYLSLPSLSVPLCPSLFLSLPLSLPLSLSLSLPLSLYLSLPLTLPLSLSKNDCHLYIFSPSLSHSQAHTHTQKAHTLTHTYTHTNANKPAYLQVLFRHLYRQAGHATENQFWFCIWDQLNKWKIVKKQEEYIILIRVLLKCLGYFVQNVN